MLSVCEIFTSIQGESTHAGCVCTFIRLAGCNLDCAYCDTVYAREAGALMAMDAVVEKAAPRPGGMVEITGGEPLIQSETPALCRRLLDRGAIVLVETNGSCDISVLPPGCIRIMDVKCPSSGMAERMLASNLACLTKRDEVKFVIANRADFDWAVDFIRDRSLNGRCATIFSPVFDALQPRELAEWIIAQRAPARLGLQLHQYLWPGETRGR